VAPALCRPPFIALNFLTRPPTGRYFSPALPSDCIAIDFPGRAISPGEGLFPLHLSFKGVAEAALYCTHRTSTVPPCAFCEQEGHLAAPFPSFGGCALREHRRSSSRPSHTPSQCARPTRGYLLHPHSARRLVWSPLRASSDHRFTVGALRAQRPCQLSRHSLFELAPVHILKWYVLRFQRPGSLSQPRDG